MEFGVEFKYIPKKKKKDEYPFEKGTKKDVNDQRGVPLEKKKKKTLFYGYGRPPWRWPYRTLSGKSPPAVCALTLTFWLEFVPTFRVYYSDDRSMPVNINQGSRKNCEERERQWGIIRIFKSIHHIEWLSARSKSNTRNSYMRNVDNRWRDLFLLLKKQNGWST